MSDIPALFGGFKNHSVLSGPFSTAPWGLWPAQAFSVFHSVGGVTGGKLRPFPNVEWLEEGGGERSRHWRLISQMSASATATLK